MSGCTQHDNNNNNNMSNTKTTTTNFHHQQQQQQQQQRHQRTPTRLSCVVSVGLQPHEFAALPANLCNLECGVVGASVYKLLPHE